MTSATHTIRRRIARTVTTAPPAPGFAGPGHTAVMVLDARDFAAQDPFIILADDRIDMPPGAALGGAHPHAGFEIATFVVDGELRDRDEGVLRAGDVTWTLAGAGVIHNEDVVPHGFTRILQLWFTVPESDRWSPPSFETVTRDAAPVRREPGVEARVYGGASGNARAPRRREHVPVTLVDVRLDAGATLEQELPASYNGFVYVLDGAVRVGDDEGTPLRAGQVGWLDRPDAEGGSTLPLTGAGPDGARVVLYAGQPQQVPIVTHGPFVGATRADLVRASREYTAGDFPRLSEIVRGARG